MRRMAKMTYRKLAEYTEGETSASKAEEIDIALSTSAEDRARLARIHAATSYLRESPSAADIDLLPKLQQRLNAPDHPLPASHHRGRFGPLALGITAAAVAAIVLPTVLFLNHRVTSPGLAAEFRAKAANTGTDPRARWIGFNVFRLSDNAEAVQLTDTLRADDALLFSYTNLGPTPFSYLMIFGVDESRRVFWYYPAFLDASDNPKSIPIAGGASRVGLREVIAHPYVEGTLTLFALFSDNRVSVSNVEAVVAKGADDLRSLEAAIDGVRVKALALEVIE